MKRAGFTMIELIFVIVILGILATVAVPKLLGVKDSAEEGLVKSFVGSLNSTVGAAKWSQSLMDGQNGALRNGDGTDNTVYDITTTDTEFPKGVTTTLTVANCADPADTNTSAVVTAVSSGSTYDIFCRDGDESTAPKFWYSKASDTNGSTTADKLGTSLKVDN